MASSATTIYEAAGGEEGLLRLSHAWHERVLADEVVGHAFHGGAKPDHGERLAAYWAEALGGPATYSERYGDETFVVRIHSGNGVHEEMDLRAIACFDQALEDVGLTGDERLRQALHDYFAWATTTPMARYHESPDDVPSGLSILRWTWDGLVTSRQAPPRLGGGKLSAAVPRAIVTGASGALGRAVVHELAARGLNVTGVDRGDVDVTDADAVEAFVERAGTPQVVVSTVGAWEGGEAVDTTPGQLHQMLAVNLESAWWISRSAGRRMRDAGGGAIVLVAAKQGIDADAGSAAYSVAKAGVIQLTKVLDAELHPARVHVNAVVPRLLDTPANRAAFSPKAMAQAVTPEAVAKVIAFLASDEAAPVSGAIVPVYG